MSDSYQAIYDAMRSKIGNGDIGRAVYDAVVNTCDASHVIQQAQSAVWEVANAMQRPSVLFRPRIYPDGRAWCALYGDDLQQGVAGFGASPEEAAIDFDANWYRKMTP